MTDILSVAVSIFAAVVAYTVGVEKWRSLQGFFLGLMLWLMFLALMVDAGTLERTIHDGRTVQIKLTYFPTALRWPLFCRWGHYCSLWANSAGKMMCRCIHLAQLRPDLYRRSDSDLCRMVAGTAPKK